MAENEIATLEGVYVLESTYFDEGGWQVMGIRCDEGGEFEPTGKVVYDMMEFFTTDSHAVKYMAVPTSIEYTGDTEPEYESTEATYARDLYFTAKYIGDFAKISEKYKVEVRFNEATGVWQRYGVPERLDGSYMLLVENGKYMRMDSSDKEHPTYYELIVSASSVKLILHSWSGIMYTKRNLGSSKCRVEGGGVVLEDYPAIVGSSRPGIKICADGIYQTNYSPFSWAPEYKVKLKKVE